jgi:hypothetical protein
MTDAEVRSWAIQDGAKRGLVASLIVVGIPLGYFGVVYLITGEPNGGESTIIHRVLNELLSFLQILVPMVSVGSIGGAAIGLLCHEILRRSWHVILTSISGFALGIATCWVALWAIAMASSFPFTGEWSEFGIALLLIGGVVGLVISRGVARNHP